jgi:hypothetical protein
MKKELMDQLKQDFPTMNFTYCECGDGWYDIIRVAAEEMLYKSKQEMKEYKFVQIKEKFGGLRLYYSPYSEYLSAYFNALETMSYVTCEITGKKGKLRTKKIVNGEFVNAWMQTLCDEEAAKAGYI